MLRTIYIALMVLPVYLHNAEPNFANSNVSVVNHQVDSFNAVVAYDTSNQLGKAPWQQASGRDEDTGDCIPRGNCKE